LRHLAPIARGADVKLGRALPVLARSGSQAIRSVYPGKIVALKRVGRKADRGPRLVAGLLSLVLSGCRTNAPGATTLEDDVHAVHDRRCLVDDAKVEGMTDPDPLLA
jgi:hypothetical protein